MWRLSTRHWVEVGRIRMKLARLNDNRMFLVLGVIALLTSCSRRTPAPAAVSQATPVAVAQVIERDVPAEIRAIGSVQAYSTVTVRSQLTGQLMKTHFKEGDKVKTGDLMFTIDPRPSQAALSQAQADL